MAAAGYRAARESHHHRVLQSLGLTIEVSKDVLGQLDAFRKKRNLTGYERMGAVSNKEVGEITDMAGKIRKQAEQWIRKNHPELL